MQKVYVRRNWENSPSTNTPLGENNLNAMDYAIDVIDARVVSLYGYEERASESEQNAKISEQNAKTSEENAKISEQNAKESELLAEEYKNLAFAGTPDGYEELVENVENFDIQTSTTTPLLNTKSGGLRFNEIGGASEQATTTGKNLLDCSGLSTTTTNGITFTPTYNANGELEYVNVNGTASAETYYNFAINKRFLAGSYIYSSNAPSSANTYFSYVSGTSGAVTRDYLGGEFALSEDSTLTVSMKIPSGQALSNVKFYPMIRLASNTDATYEPYTNGASPNPNYPQAIENAFDCVEMIQGVYLDSNGTFSTSDKGICSKSSIPCNSGDIIKVDAEWYESLRVSCYNNGTFIKSLNANKPNNEFTIPSGVTEFKFNIFDYTNGITPQTAGKISLTINGNSVVQIKTVGKNIVHFADKTTTQNGVTITVKDNVAVCTGTPTNSSGAIFTLFGDDISLSLLKDGVTYYARGCNLKIVLKDGTTQYQNNMVYDSATIQAVQPYIQGFLASYTNGMTIYMKVTLDPNDEFEPYKETSSTITLSEPLRAVGEVKDQIVKQNGVWGVSRKLGWATFDGSDDEEWALGVTNTSSKKRVYTMALKSLVKKSTSNTEIANGLSNYTMAGNVNHTYRCTDRFAIGSDGMLLVYDSNYNTSDITLWTSRLAEHPMTLAYELATPTFEPLDTESQIALNSLETFDGATHIVFDSTVEPTFEVEYGMSSASAYSLKALNDSEANALGGKATNSKELTNGELYSNIIRGYKYGRTVVLSLLNVEPLVLTTYLMNNSGFLDNAHDIYANVNLLIAGTYAGIGTFNCSANKIGTSEDTDYMYMIQYYPSTSSSSTVMSDNETASISGTITYVATNFDI